MQNVSLFIADELHLIGGAVGPTMEVVTSRMRYISSQLEKPIRIVGLCTSLANARDLGEWIGASSHGLFNFAPGVRPVPLDIRVTGIDIVNFEARMQAMARPVYSAICQHAADGEPSIVFVPTRKHAKLASLDLPTFAAADGKPQKFLACDPEDLAPHIGKISDSPCDMRWVSVSRFSTSLWTPMSASWWSGYFHLVQRLCQCYCTACVGSHRFVQAVGDHGHTVLRCRRRRVCRLPRH